MSRVDDTELVNSNEQGTIEPGPFIGPQLNTSKSEATIGVEEKFSPETSEKLKRLQLFVDAGILTQSDFNAKKEKLLIEDKAAAMAARAAKASSLATLNSAPFISTLISEANSAAVRIGAPALLNEYFQHIKGEKPEMHARIIPPTGLRPAMTVCTISCKIAGKVLTESLAGPNKKLVRAEVAMTLLRKLLPELQRPEEIVGHIKGMSRMGNSGARRLATVALLKGTGPDFSPGVGRIESLMGVTGSTAPVVCGAADDPSRLLQSYCEFQRVPMPNLITCGYNEFNEMTGKMELIIDDMRFFTFVEAADVMSVRQEACLDILRQIFPGDLDDQGIQVEIDKMKGEEHRKKKQKIESEVVIPASSLSASLINYYCQVMKLPMPELDKENKLSITDPEGKLHTVTVGAMNKKVARAEGCLLLLQKLFPGKELDDVRGCITALQKENKAKGSKPKPQVEASRPRPALPWANRSVIPNHVPNAPPPAPRGRGW